MRLTREQVTEERALTNGDNNSFEGSMVQPQAQDKLVRQEETGWRR